MRSLLTLSRGGCVEFDRAMHSPPFGGPSGTAAESRLARHSEQSLAAPPAALSQVLTTARVTKQNQEISTISRFCLDIERISCILYGMCTNTPNPPGDSVPPTSFAEKVAAAHALALDRLLAIVRTSASEREARLAAIAILRYRASLNAKAAPPAIEPQPQPNPESRSDCNSPESATVVVGHAQSHSSPDSRLLTHRRFNPPSARRTRGSPGRCAASVSRGSSPRSRAPPVPAYARS